MGKVQRKKNIYIHRLLSGLNLLLLIVTVFGGMRAGVSAQAIAFRACCVMLVVSVVGRVLLSVLATFEEM